MSSHYESPFEIMAEYDSRKSSILEFENVMNMLKTYFPNEKLREEYIKHMASALQNGPYKKILYFHDVCNGCSGKSTLKKLYMSALGNYAQHYNVIEINGHFSRSPKIFPSPPIPSHIKLLTFDVHEDTELSILQMKCFTSNSEYYCRGLFDIVEKKNGNFTVLFVKDYDLVVPKGCEDMVANIIFEKNFRDIREEDRNVFSDEFIDEHKYAFLEILKKSLRLEG